MANQKATHVLYAADQDGYTVRVMSASGTVDEYNGGNSHFDSMAWVNPSDRIAVPVEALKKYARQTAIEMAKGYDLTGEGR